MKTLINLSLTLVLVGLFVIPVVAIHRAVSFEQASSAGIVAGAQDISYKDINILPNLRDFNGFVSFNPIGFVGNEYKDNVELTIFQRQKATYRGLFTLYNTSKTNSLKISIVSDVPTPEYVEFDRIMIGFNKGEYGTALGVQVEKGQTILPLPDFAVSPGDTIVIGDESVEVVFVSDGHIVISPLQKSHTDTEKMYPQSVVLRPGRVEYPVSSEYVLEPGEKVLISAEVIGSADLLQNDTKVSVPLVVRVSRL